MCCESSSRSLRGSRLSYRRRFPQSAVCPPHAPPLTVINNDALLDRTSHACHFLSVQVHYLPQDGGGEEHAEPRMAGLHHPSPSPLQRRLRQVLATHWLGTAYTLVTRWLHTGYTLATHWLHTGYTLVTHWLGTGYTLVTHWLHTG